MRVILFFSILCLLANVTGCREKLLPKQKQAVQKTVDFVDKFKLSIGRYPTRDEFFVWSKTNDLEGVYDYESFGTEYRISIWRGERALTYFSKDQSVREKQ
jgi:hypothetical protein